MINRDGSEPDCLIWESDTWVCIKCTVQVPYSLFARLETFPDEEPNVSQVMGQGIDGYPYFLYQVVPNGSKDVVRNALVRIVEGYGFSVSSTTGGKGGVRVSLTKRGN